MAPDRWQSAMLAAGADAAPSTTREDRRMRLRFRVVVDALVCAIVATTAYGVAAFAQGTAQDYPSRPVTIAVPFGPGSATDTIARIIGQHLGTALSQSIVIENKPGANGAIAAAYVARSAPDGYMLFLSTNSPHSAAPSLNKTLAYDPIRDFTPLSRVGSYTLVLVVHPDVPAKSVPELIAHV